MASGSFESRYGINLEIGCEWTSSANVADNTSTVRVRVYLRHFDIYCVALNGSYVSAGSDRRTFARAVSSDSPVYAKTYIADETFTVPHSSDGTKTLNISAGWVFNGTYNGTYVGTVSVSSSVTLDTIPRATAVNPPAKIEVGGQTVLALRPASPSFTHKATLTVGSETWTSGFGGTSLTLSPPASMALAISGKTRVGTLKLDTYNGSVKVGTASANVTFSVPDRAEFRPDFTLNFATDSEYAAVRALGAVAQISSGTVSVGGVVTAYGATVSSVDLSLGDAKGSGNSLTVQSLKAGETEYSATVTDSRGHKTTKTGTVTVAQYSRPYPSGVTVERCTAGGAPDGDGEYLAAASDVSFSSLDGANAATLRLTVALRHGGVVGEYTLTPGVRRIINVPVLKERSYDVTVTASDIAGEGAASHAVIPTSEVDLHIKDGSVRFGGYIEREGFECDMTARFGGGVTVDDKPLSDFVTERGESDGWRWKKYASGDAVCFGVFSGSAPAVPSGVFDGTPESVVIGADGGRSLVIKYM